MRQLLAFALAGLSAGCFLNAAEPSKLSLVETAKVFQFQKTRTAHVNYLLFLPDGYRPDGDKRWPLILFLHGAGERGSDIWRVAVHGPPKRVATHPDFPFIVVSPQCPEDQVWSNELLLGLLDEVLRLHAVDTHRVYLTGLSMGGYGTWSLGLAHPERFAALAPICGGGELLTVLLSTHEGDLKTLGIWAFHGAKDPVVPVTESQRMVEFLKTRGVPDVKMTVYPEAEHDAWTETYNNPDLYAWFLQHRRP